jgi:sarcosine oxidase
MAPVHDVAIVGAGLLGLAAARAAARRDRDFVVLEQAEIGHQGAGSKGSCRIFRLGYPQADYVTAARQARELWHELEQETGRPILLPTPHITFGPQLAAVHEAMRQAGAPCRLLSGEETAARFPDIHVGGPALMEPESCVIAADEALLALAASAGLIEPGGRPGAASTATAIRPGRSGARLRTGVRVTSVADDGRQVTLQTSEGAVAARLAIITAGPWTAGLLAGQVPVPSSPTLEQVAYLSPAGQPRSQTPIFICHGEQSPYGLPVPGSPLYKIGIHQSGPPAAPDAQTSGPDPALVARLTQVAARYLPGYRPDPVETERCIYDNTPDEDFVVDRIGNVVIGCGTSGHGFKFGPLFGEWLSTLAFGAGAGAAGAPAATPGGRFGLARFLVPGRS